MRRKVKLTQKERRQLEELTRKGKEKARKLTRCRILLLSNDGKSDTAITEALGISHKTVRQIRKRYEQEGLKAALEERPRPGAPAKFTGRQKAKITALACSNPPNGYSRWSLRLLTDKLVELEMVDDISYMSVQRVLKKTS